MNQSGHIVRVDIVSSRTPLSRGHQQETIVILNDVTEAHDAHLRDIELRNFHQLMIESIPDFFFVKDKNFALSWLIRPSSASTPRTNAIALSARLP